MSYKKSEGTYRSEMLNHMLSAGVALALGCGFVMPVSVEAADTYSYGVTTSGSRASDTLGPFKLVYLEQGDTYDVYKNGVLEHQSVVNDSLVHDPMVRYFAVQPAIEYFAQAIGEKDALNNSPAEGCITYYIGMQPMSGAFVASAGYDGVISDIYQKLVTPDATQQNSLVYMNFNDSRPIYVYDYPRAVSMENAANPMRVVMHEFTHSLGMVDSVVKNVEGKYYWSSNINAYSQGLYDIFGTQARAGQEIVLVDDGNMASHDADKFYLCKPDAANYKNPTYHGTAPAGSVSNVDQLTNNKGVSILGALKRVVNDVQEDYILNGSSLSHVDSLLSYMHFGNYGANTMVTELDLALLQDLGYNIDRGKYFGASYLSSGKISSKGTVNNVSGNIYEENNSFTGEEKRTFVTGAHIYRNNLTLNQNADINVKGPYGAGVLISGADNTLNVASGTTISANNDCGIGIGVNYGSRNNINIAGTVEAMGEQGVGLLINGDCENYYSKETYIASRSNPSLASDPATINKWAEMAENNNGTKGVIDNAITDNNGYSVNNVNITGTLAGKYASIYIGSYNYIKDINVSGNGKIIGDILFAGNPVWKYSKVISDAGHYMDTNLNFGLDGSGLVDSNYKGSFSGNISYPWDYGEGSDPLKTGCALIYLNHKGGTLDLNGDKKQDEAAIAVLGLTNDVGTITNLGSTLYLWSMGYSYPHEQPAKVGTVEINGTLRPGGTSYANIQILSDEYKQGDSGKLQLDFDLNTLEHDSLYFSGRGINGNYLSTSVELGKLEFVEQNAYHGAPVMLTREDFFRLGLEVNLDEGGLEASIVTKEEAYGADSGAVILAAEGSGGSGTGYTELRNTWAVYSFGSGFAANMPNSSTQSEIIACLLDAKVADFAQVTLADRELMSGFMTQRDTSLWGSYAEQLIDTSYAQQLAASMNINHYLSSANRCTALDVHGHGDGDWHWFANPLAFTAREQGKNGYSQNGNGMLLGADKQLGNTTFGFFGGYMHDNTSLYSTNPLHSKREGGFAGAYFKQAKDPANGAFLYGFARYDNSKAKNKRSVAFGRYADTNAGEFRQHGGAVELGAGWNKANKRGTLTYNVGVNYAVVQQGAFTENDGSGSAVGMEKGNYRSVLGNAGVQYTTNMAPLNRLTDYRVSGAASWNQELLRSDRDYSISLLGGELPVHWENKADKGWLELSLQGEFIYKKNLAVVASVGTELFRKNHRGLSGSIKLEYGF